MTNIPSTRRDGRSARGMAIYVYLVSIATLVSILALAASAVVRIERRQTSSISNRLIARSHAHSAVELGLRRITTSTNWRSTYANGVATTPLNLGTAAAGSVSWLIEDTDGSLTDADTEVRLRGLGRIGDAVQVASVKLEAGATGPSLLRSYTTSGSTEELKNSKWWGQYFRPSLPADAHRWWVSSVEIYAREKDNNRAFRIRLYRPNGSNMPSAEIMDQVNLNSDDFGGWAWDAIPMSGVYSMAATEGLCLTIESTSGGTPIELEYVSGGVADANSALLRGTPAWSTYETDKALRYRVYGYYTTTTGVSGADGTWIWDSQ